MGRPAFAPVRRVAILVTLATSALGVSLLAGVLHSRAVQNPTLAIDMVPADNTYDDSSNTMTVAFNPNTDFCLATNPANPSTHIHNAHVIVQNVEDLVGWQVRLNYTGNRFRPNTVNFTPFTDNNTGQNISFVNLPIDESSSVHRDVINAASIPPSAPGPQTAAFGSTYIGAPTFPVSADTPPKTTPDDSSYSAPAGGVLASFGLQVVGDQSGQLLFMDMDDANPKTPGSGVAIFDGIASQDVLLPEGKLGDAGHAEGALCQPPTPTPTPPPPTPTPPPGTPTPPPGTPTPVPGPSPTPCKCFNPQSSVTFASTSPSANSDIELTFDLEAPDYLFSDVMSFTPTQVGIAAGAEIPDGARVGTLNSQATLGLLNNACANPTAVDFALFDATTNTSNTITASFDFLAGDVNSDGVADIRPPPIVTQYPSFLNTLFGGVTPRARYAGATRIPSAGLWAILQFIVFEPGTVLPGFAFDPALGYPSVTVLLDPTAPPGPITISDLCSPITTNANIFGITQDNPDTPANEGGIALRTNPAAAGPIDFTVFAASRRDADGDGIENNLDPCPFHTDAVWDPRDATPPVEGDSDIFAGSSVADGIPDSCDTTPTQPTNPPGGQPTDHDGDGFINRLDNCPLVFNPDQADGDLNSGGVPTPDGIGNACDTPGTNAGSDVAGRPIAPRSVAGQGPTVPDGPRLLCTRTITVVIGGPNQGVAGSCSQTLPGSEVPCEAPVNDSIGSATVAPGVPFSDQVTTTCATTAPDDPDCFGRGHNVWYSFTASESLRVEANTFGSSYATSLSVYTGSPGSLVPVACNPGAPGANQARVRFDAAAGQTYWFMVASFVGGPGGNLVFSLDIAPPALNVAVDIASAGSVVARDGTASVHGTVRCSKPAFIFLPGELSQKAGRATISGPFSASVFCEDEVFWQADVQGENGRFSGGKAGVSLQFFAFALDEDEFSSGQASGSVVLRGSRPPPVTRCTGQGNDGFEVGVVDSNGIPCWTVADQEGGSGSWCNQTGSAPPQGACAGSGAPVVPPVEGAQAAMTNQQGPGSHVLYQCGVLRSATISFQLQINNQAGAFLSPPSLNFAGLPNQQFRADLITAAGATANPFIVATEDVLLNIYQTRPGDPAVSGYATVTADASAYIGRDVCLRFAQVDNQLFFNAGVDAVRVDLRRRRP